MTITGLPALCRVQMRASVPIFTSRIAAGFPSPADDYLDHPLDFNELLIVHPAATFAVKVAGNSMEGAGIYAGDIAVVDRALTAVDGSVILGILDGEFTIKTFRRTAKGAWLEAANPAYAPITLDEHRAFEVWGVVRYTLHRLI